MSSCHVSAVPLIELTVIGSSKVIRAIFRKSNNCLLSSSMVLQSNTMFRCSWWLQWHGIRVWTDWKWKDLYHDGEIILTIPLLSVLHDHNFRVLILIQMI